MPYPLGIVVQFVWDSPKAESNEVKHGVTFTFASRVFDDTGHVDLDVSRPEDGEQRWKAIGAVQGQLYSVVYTVRGSSVWIISARRTNPKEDKQYDRNVRP